MGTVVHGGGGCMCHASSFLQAFLRHVILKDTSAVIIDMEAGIEHLGRGITRGINLMVIIVEPGTRSIQTAQRVVELGEEIGIKHFAAVINKAKESAPIKKRLAELNIQTIGSIPYDPLLVEADINGLAPLDVGGKAVESIKKIKDRILNRYGPDRH
jgi:CO dehydrogenase maturation factor